MAKNKKRVKRPISTTENLAPEKVKMKFSEHKYYNDLDKPLFEAGKVYELEGAGWIQRWLKRGGEIVEGSFALPAADEPNPSTIVPPGPQGGEQDGDKAPQTGDAGPDADQGKADGQEPDADGTEETDAE